ncbi:MAG: hypothetical protein JW870_04915 [Candidatus Delongbacteria bacterium]|nr:hypothetical protein [Candidatus Delongbacteria bacterium]
MITLLVLVSLFVSYIIIIFCRGVYREKKDKKIKDKSINSDDDVFNNNRSGEG